MMVRRDPAGVRLLTRNGYDWTGRFPLIAEAAGALRARSFLIDGEAVACDDNGVTSFNRVRYRRHHANIFLYAFHLIEFKRDDLRRDPLESRKASLVMILAKAGLGIRFNDHMKGDGETVFRHACKLGLEGTWRRPWYLRVSSLSGGNARGHFATGRYAFRRRMSAS